MSDSSTKPELTDEKKAQQENNKLLFDVYKHITTLSSGTIVILATFLDKVFKNPKMGILITFSITSLLMALIGALPVMVDLAEEQKIKRDSKAYSDRAHRFMYFLAPTTFVFGTFCLALFTIINLFL